MLTVAEAVPGWGWTPEKASPEPRDSRKDHTYAPVLFFRHGPVLIRRPVFAFLWAVFAPLGVVPWFTAPLEGLGHTISLAL